MLTILFYGSNPRSDVSKKTKYKKKNSKPSRFLAKTLRVNKIAMENLFVNTHNQSEGLNGCNYQFCIMYVCM